MNLRSIAAAVVAAFLLLPIHPAQTASTHAPAKRLGDVDVSLFCPAGSAWYPVRGGACLTCPGNVKPKAGTCPGIRPARKTKAVFSHRRKGPVCRLGTFRNPAKTRDCYKCPKGYARVPGVKFNRNGICWSAPKPFVAKPTVALKISLKEMLNPGRLSAEAQNLGCKGYGRNAVFSPVGGGTCWSCPRSHPKRTGFPVNSKKACGTASCGGSGERACNVFAGEGWPCKKGLNHNSVTGLCQPRKAFACKPTVATVGGIYKAAGKAGEAGQNAMEKVPGLNLVMDLIRKPIEKMEEKFAGLVDKLPKGNVLANVDNVFGSPEQADAMRRAVDAVQSNRERLTSLLHNGDSICDPRSDALKRAFADTINQAFGKRTDAGGGSIFTDLGLMSTAHASTPVRIRVPLLYNTKFRIAAMGAFKIPKLPTPIVVGVQGIFVIGSDGEVTVIPRLAGGLNITGFPIGRAAQANFYAGFLWGSPTDELLKSLKLWIESPKTHLAFAVDLKARGSLNVRLGTKKKDRAGHFFTADAAKGALTTSGPGAKVVMGLRSKFLDFTGPR